MHKKLLYLSPQRLFMMDDREVVLVKMENPGNAVEFQDATLAWEKARAPAVKPNPPPKMQGGIRRALRREKLSLYIPTGDGKGDNDSPKAQSLLTNMEQESPQSTISSTQSMRPPLHKTLHRIDLRVKKVTGSTLPWLRAFCSHSWAHICQLCLIPTIPLFLSHVGFTGWHLWRCRERKELSPLSSAGTGEIQLL